MKKYSSIFLLIVAVSMFVVTKAYADSSSTVIINNDVSSSSNSNCHTTVHMVVNGEEKDYDSSNCDDVNMQSGDNTVHVSNNNPVTTTSIATPTSNPTSEPQPTLILTYTPVPTIDQEKVQKEVQKVQQKIENQTKKMQEKQQNFIQKLQDFLKKLFSFY